MALRANQTSLQDLQLFAEKSKNSVQFGLYYDPYKQAYVNAFKYDRAAQAYVYITKFRLYLENLDKKGDQMDTQNVANLTQAASTSMATIGSGKGRQAEYKRLRNSFQEQSKQSAAADKPPKTPVSKPKPSGLDTDAPISPEMKRDGSDDYGTPPDPDAPTSPLMMRDDPNMTAPGVDPDMNIQLDIQEAKGQGGGESKQENSTPGMSKQPDGPSNQPANLQGQARKKRGRHENNTVPQGAGNAGGGESKQGGGNDNPNPPPPNPPPPNPQQQPPVPPAGGGGGGGGGPPGGGGGGGGAPPAGGGNPAGPGGGGDDEPDDPTDTSAEINRGLPGQPGTPMMPFGSMTSSTAQRVSMERNRMRYSAKKLLMEIRAFVVIYRDDIKTAHFKRLVKTSRTLSVKTPLIRFRKIHRELEEEVIDFYRNQSGLRMGIILDPGAAGLDVTQLQNIMAPHMSFGGAGEVVRELATAADVGKFPETSQKAESVHYHLGGLAHATKAVLPEGKNLDDTFNPAERNRLQNRRTAPIRISAEPKRRYLFQDKRQPFVPKNIKIKSIKC